MKFFNKITVLLATIAALMFGALVPLQTVSASSHCDSSFFCLPTWHKYLDKDADGDIKEDSNDFVESNKPWLIGAAVLEILIRISAFIAIFVMIGAGFQIMTSSGNPEGMAKGGQRMLAAIIGLIIAVMSTIVISYLTSYFIGSNAPDPVTGLPGVSTTGALELILNLIYRIAAGWTILYVILGGFAFVTASGDSQKVAKARNHVLYAVIGLAVTLLSVLIVTLVGSTV